MLRRLKRDVMSQLPAKRRQVVRLPRPRASDWPPAGGHKSDGKDWSVSASARAIRAVGPAVLCGCHWLCLVEGRLLFHH
jgi:hypothetical protein